MDSGMIELTRRTSSSLPSGRSALTAWRVSMRKGMAERTMKKEA